MMDQFWQLPLATCKLLNNNIGRRKSQYPIKQSITWISFIQKWSPCFRHYFQIISYDSLEWLLILFKVFTKITLNYEYCFLFRVNTNSHFSITIQNSYGVYYLIFMMTLKLQFKLLCLKIFFTLVLFRYEHDNPPDNIPEDAVYIRFVSDQETKPK